MSNKKPLLVGLTGGIGSGKSTVAKIFQILGIPTYFADDRAKWLMANEPELIKEIKSNFGTDSYLEDGSVNRAYLSKEVFSDPEKVKKINSIVHPSVGKDFKSWVTLQKSPYVLKEAALIFESGSNQDLDYVINVSSPLKVRVARVLMRDDHRTEEQINQIIDQQMPDEAKNKISDFIIKNVDNKLLIPQVLKIHNALLTKQEPS
ncbi:dephospho-CoA kinase [Algoriphagus sp.]|uniref:dephospho-CoA kinase n=1 Tax=Algoriphagus sp. TaxID=1872435 RepID=UPI0025FB1CE5|nr:dephospho-CoA kinase [Algoriphagus sp.]